MNSVNHQKYDHVFKIVFSNREELLSLYNALAETAHTDPEEITVNTLEDAVFIGIKNDLSFIIDSRLNLFEHQSTINPNIPLRGLYYLSDIYKTMYSGTMLHSTKAIRLLSPRFIVFYNGKEEMPDTFECKLSDMFINKEEHPDLDVTAHVININPGHNEELLDKCGKLREFSVFSAKMREALDEARGLSKEDLEKIVLKVIDSCIEENILADILRKERVRVMDSVLAEFDIDDFAKMTYEDGYDFGYNSAILSLYSKGKVSKEDVAEYTGISESELNSLLNQYNAINP